MSFFAGIFLKIIDFIENYSFFYSQNYKTYAVFTI